MTMMRVAIFLLLGSFLTSCHTTALDPPNQSQPTVVHPRMGHIVDSPVGSFQTVRPQPYYPLDEINNSIEELKTIKREDNLQNLRELPNYH